MSHKLVTPIRYPGGKSRATKFLMPKMPSDITEYREPFVGGGSMAFAFSLANPNAKIWINDLYYNLYCFWTALQADPKRFCDEMMAKKVIAEETGEDGHRALFAECKDTLASVDAMNASSRHKIGQAWWCLNKMSFSGLTETGTFSRQASVSNFSMLQCSKLAAYGHHIKDWTITNLDYTCLLDAWSTSVCIFLDPPYDKVGKKGGSVLYGKNGNMHAGFNHLKFYEDCQKTDGQCLITYDSNPELVELWKSWYPEKWDLTYTMHSSKKYRADEHKRKELLLSNYEREAHHAQLDFG